MRIFGRAREVFRKVPPKLVVVPHHGVWARPTPNPPTTAKTFWTPGIKPGIKHFVKLHMWKMLATKICAEGGFGPTDPQKQPARWGTDSAPRLACFLGSVGRKSGRGPPSIPALDKRRIATTAIGGCLPPNLLKGRTLKTQAREEHSRCCNWRETRDSPATLLAARLAATALLSPITKLARAWFPADTIRLEHAVFRKVPQRLPLTHATGCRPSRPTRYGRNVFDTRY